MLLKNEFLSGDVNKPQFFSFRLFPLTGLFGYSLPYLALNMEQIFCIELLFPISFPVLEEFLNQPILKKSLTILRKIKIAFKAT